VRLNHYPANSPDGSFTTDWNADDRIWPGLFGEFIVGLNVDAFDLDSLKSAAGGVDLETKFGELAGERDSAFCVAVVAAEEDVTLLRKRVEGRDLGFGIKPYRDLRRRPSLHQWISFLIRGRCRFPGSDPKGGRLLWRKSMGA
jgi:hypothetical protein